MNLVHCTFGLILAFSLSIILFKVLLEHLVFKVYSKRLYLFSYRLTTFLDSK